MTSPYSSEPAPNIETTLLGLTLTTITLADAGDDRIEMTTSDGRSFALYHDQDCCECVQIDAVRGRLDKLIGSPLTSVKETIESGEGGSYEDHWTKTTFELSTANHSVAIYWLGTSNGYYSESVSFVETTKKTKTAIR